MVSVANLQRISAAQLSELILAGSAGNKKLAVVDVRDDDHIGGHIKGSLHFPSGSLDATLPTLVRKLQDADTIVFHCALSQQRGPGAALRYLRAVEQEAQAAVDAAAKESHKPKQTVYVLDRGFVGWQEAYGEDVRLTEGFRKELWRDY